MTAERRVDVRLAPSGPPSRPRRLHPRSRSAWPLTVAVATVVAAVLWPGAVWLLAVVAAVSLARVLQRSVSATIAGVGAAALVLLCVVAAVRHPFVGTLDPHLVVLACWSAIALGSGVAAVVGPQPSPFSEGGRHRLWRPSAVAALLAPLGGAVVWAVAVAVTPGAARIGWAMNRDSANNLMFARFMIEDGGVDPLHQSNPAFLSQAIFAVAFPSDRPVVPSHLLVASAIAWAVALVAAATLMTLFVLRTARSRVAPVIAALTGLGTYSWFIAGQTFSFGFLNVSLVLLLLVAAILVAVDPRALPWHVVVVQSLLATLMLANWAPLVVLPAGLAALRLLRGPERRLPEVGARWTVIAVALALGQLAAYFLAVVLPDLRTDGGNLTQGGWIFPVSPITWIVASGWTTLVAIGRIRRRPRPLGPAPSWRVECVALVATSVLSLTVILFMALNHASGTPLWTYYPQKLAWITTLVDLVLLAALLGQSSDTDDATDIHVDVDTSLLTRPRASLQRRIFAGFAWVVIGVALLASAAPSVQGPGVGGVVPLVRMLRGGDYPGAEDAAVTAMRLADQPQPHLVWLYGTLEQNTTINRWLVSARATSTRDPIRTLGDVFAPTPADVCAVIHALGPGVVVHTNADNVPAALVEQCGATEDFRVVTGLVP